MQRPQEIASFSGLQWDHVIRLARAADLSARLGFLAQREGVWDQIPQAPRKYLESALRVADRQQRELGYEIQEIELALPGTWPVGPEVKGAIRGVAGVALVEEF